jgi:hypothetical protein
VTDPDNRRNRLENAYNEIVVTSRIVRHMLARVALGRELRCVFDELSSPVGCVSPSVDATSTAVPSGPESRPWAMPFLWPTTGTARPRRAP